MTILVPSEDRYFYGASSLKLQFQTFILKKRRPYILQHTTFSLLILELICNPIFY